MTMAADKQDKVLNVPTLRFPEFDGEWHHTTIGDCCSPLEYGMNAPAKEYDGANKYIRITDIDEDTCTYKCDDVVSPNAQLEDKYRVRKNDILFARTGASTGKAYLYNEEDGLMYYAGFLIRGNVKPAYNAKFVFLQTQTQKYKKWVDIMSIRSGQPGINSQEYSGFKFHLPPSKVEQDKISTLFTLLDERITTQIRIIEKLQSLMKGLAEHLTEFTPNTKIADCLNCHSSVLQENQVKSEGKYKVYGANGVCGYSNRPAILEDAILIVKDGSGVGNVSYATGEYSVIGTSNYLTAKSGYSLKYLYYSLMIFNFVPYRTGMAIPHIYFKDYEKALIYCPSLDKQVQIATILSKIEYMIETEKAITDYYQQQKRFLLESMFI